MTDHEDLEAIAVARLGSVLLGKYRLERLLGIGGMASVYAATHRNQAEFAVKMLHATLSQLEDVRTRFLREGYIANSVKHPGSVRVVDDDVAEDGSAFLVMDLLHGSSVEDLWFRSDRVMPARAALAIGHQLLDVLAAAHDKNIVHRDIKPANLFVTQTGELKVLDFGIARLRDATGGSLHATTQSGTMLGTPAFMAPEQALGKSREVDARTDIWAVGATLFTLLSGSLVHEAETAPQLLVKAAVAQARPLASVAPDVQPVVASVLDKALAFDKVARWQTAAQMRDALRDAYVAAFDEALTSAVLAAYITEMDGPPLPTAPPPPGAGAFAASPKPASMPPPAGMSAPVIAASPVLSSAPGAERTLVVPVQSPARASAPAAVEGPLERAIAPERPAAPERLAPPLATSGLTTSQPVSRESREPEPIVSKKRGRGPLVAGAVLAVGVGLGVVVVATVGGHETPPKQGPASAPPVMSVTPSASPSAAPTNDAGPAVSPAKPK